MSDGIRCLLVDDEVLSRLALRQALASHPDIQVIGECANGPEALVALRALRPDLLLLDIQMPGMDGFALLGALETSEIPLVVLVTAFDEHALRAFDAHALDYLLKPLDQRRFDLAMARVREQSCGPRVGPPQSLLRFVAGASTPLERLSVRKDEHLVVIPVDDIVWIQSAGNYVRIHTSGDHYLHRQSLSDLAADLDPQRFLRIHRSAAVNVNRIREIHPLLGGACEVRLEDGTRLTLSRRFRKQARAILGALP